MTTHKRINLLKRLGRIIEMGPRVAKETRRASGCCASWSNSNTCARGPTRLGALLEAHRKLIVLDASNGGQLDLQGLRLVGMCNGWPFLYEQCARY